MMKVMALMNFLTGELKGGDLRNKYCALLFEAKIEKYSYFKATLNLLVIIL